MHSRQQRLLAYMQPSWLVNLVAVSLGIILTAIVVVGSRYAASDLRLQVAGSPNALGQPTFYTAATDFVTHNQFLAVLPLLLVWSGVGLVVYFFAMTVAHSIGQAAELHEELDYVHISRRALLRQALLELGLRTAAIIGWFALLKLSLAVFLPYAVNLSTIGAQAGLPGIVFYAVGSVAVIYLTVCLHAAFLRAVLLKIRVFN